MTRQKYSCTYAQNRGNVRSENGGVFCRISDKSCRYVQYEFPFGSEVLGEMNECPAYNISQKLAKALISARFNREKSEFEAKLDK